MAIRCDRIRELEQAPEYFDRRVAVIIPAFNEAKHIQKLLARCAAIEPVVVVVVDDASTDDTPDVLSEERAEWRACGLELVVLRNATNLGKQGSVRRALLWLKDCRLDAVALIDGDGQHDPTELPRLVELLDDYHFVIGARSREQMPLHRQLSNALVNISFLAIGGVDFLDVQSGLRVYRKELSDVLADELPSEGGYGLEHESLSVIARYAQNSESEVRAAAAPTSCVYGEAKSKIKAEDVIELAYQTVRHAWRIRRASWREAA